MRRKSSAHQFVILSEAKDLKIRKCLISQRRNLRSFVASLLRMTSGFGPGVLRSTFGTIEARVMTDAL